MTTPNYWGDLGDEVMTETAWERAMLSAGFERFSMSHVRKDGKAIEFSDSAIGEKAIKELLQRAERGVRKLQEQLVTARVVPMPIKMAICTIPADTLAAITLRAALNRIYNSNNPDRGDQYQYVCLRVAQGVENEVNFRHWIATSLEDAREYAIKVGVDKPPMAIAERLIRDQGVNRSTLTKWKRAFEELTTYQWDKVEKHHIGDLLLTAVVKAVPFALVIHLVPGRGNMTNYLKMHDDYRKKLNDRFLALAYMQSAKKPMLSRPEPWEPILDQSKGEN